MIDNYVVNIGAQNLVLFSLRLSLCLLVNKVMMERQIGCIKEELLLIRLVLDS